MSTPKTQWSVLPAGTSETVNLSWNGDVTRALLEGNGTVLLRRVGTLIERGDLSGVTAGATTREHFGEKGKILLQMARTEAAAAADLVERIQRKDPSFTATPAEYGASIPTLGSEIYRTEFARMRREVVQDEMMREVGLFVRTFEASVAPEVDMDLDEEYVSAPSARF